MKKPLLVLILNAFMALTSWGQLNPIKNLNWYHVGVGFGSNNCFSLSWNKPDTSLTDTLEGYNIYRNDSLYSFTTDTVHNCMGDCGGPNSSFCDFLNYNAGTFYIHVTAVYNSKHIESNYTDSSYNDFVADGIKIITNKELEISTVIQNNSLIIVGLSQPLDGNGLLIVSNCLGQETDKITLPKGQQQFTINSPVSGFYFLRLKTNNEAVVRKIVVK